MGKQEAVVEQYLNQQVQKLGGITRKWVSPGHDGVPDRICIIKGYIVFVEVKTINGKVSTRQRREIDELTRNGCHTAIVFGTQGVDSFVRGLVGDLNA